MCISTCKHYWTHIYNYCVLGSVILRLLLSSLLPHLQSQRQFCSLLFHQSPYSALLIYSFIRNFLLLLFTMSGTPSYLILPVPYQSVLDFFVVFIKKSAEIPPHFHPYLVFHFRSRLPQCYRAKDRLTGLKVPPDIFSCNTKAIWPKNVVHYFGSRKMLPNFQMLVKHNDDSNLHDLPMLSNANH